MINADDSCFKFADRLSDAKKINILPVSVSAPDALNISVIYGIDKLFVFRVRRACGSVYLSLNEPAYHVGIIGLKGLLACLCINKIMLA